MPCFTRLKNFRRKIFLFFYFFSIIFSICFVLFICFFKTLSKIYSYIIWLRLSTLTVIWLKLYAELSFCFASNVHEHIQTIFSNYPSYVTFYFFNRHNRIWLNSISSKTSIIGKCDCLYNQWTYRVWQIITTIISLALINLISFGYVSSFSYISLLSGVSCVCFQPYWCNTYQFVV